MRASVCVYVYVYIYKHKLSFFKWPPERAIHDLETRCLHTVEEKLSNKYMAAYVYLELYPIYFFPWSKVNFLRHSVKLTVLYQFLQSIVTCYTWQLKSRTSKIKEYSGINSGIYTSSSSCYFIFSYHLFLSSFFIFFFYLCLFDHSRKSNVRRALMMWEQSLECLPHTIIP